MINLILTLQINSGVFDVKVDCPPSISVDQQLSKPVDGWTAGRSGSLHRLAGITFFVGPPGKKQSLEGEDRDTTTKLVSSWAFARNEEYWIQCVYDGTDVVLSRPVPKSFKSCSVSYSRSVRVAGLPMILRTQCK